MIFRARFVAPVNAPAIENGAVEVSDGAITAIGVSAEFSRQPQVDFGDAVLAPGFVNAHTHLELSQLENRVPPSPDFTDWLKRLIAVRAQDVRDAGASTVATSLYVERAMREGIRKSLKAGVTAVGDITARPDLSRPTLASSPLRAVSFGEVIAVGRSRPQLDARLLAAADQTLDSNRFRAGISPHAPYTVEPAALKICAHRAARGEFPLCIHVAETAEEERFTREGCGDFLRFLQGLGMWDDAVEIPRASPVELLAVVEALTPRTLLAHANYVSDQDISLIAASGASVAYCPRTHAAFGHAPHRFREMLHAGINVCLGTDSLASNPSLSILDELRFLQPLCRGMAPDEMLALATLRGARALGMERFAGTLTPGKCADFVVIPLPPAARTWDSIFQSSDEVATTYIDGNEMARNAVR